MGVLPRCDLINTGTNKLLTNILQFLILEHGIATVIGKGLSARPDVWHHFGSWALCGGGHHFE